MRTQSVGFYIAAMLSSTATTTIDRDETEELGKALGLDFALTFLFLPRPFASANKPAEEDPPEKVLLDAKKTGSDLIKKEFDDEGKISDGMSGMRLSYFGRRYYDPEVGVWITCDPANQFWDAYGYAGNGYNPVIGVDADGYVLKVFSSSVLPHSGMNHAFVYGTEARDGIGMHGSQVVVGHELQQFMKTGNGVDDINSSKYTVVDLQGKDELSVIAKMKEWPGWNKGTWHPWKNDCHDQLQAAFKYARVEYPGAPNGRLDWNESYNAEIEGIRFLERQLSGGKANPVVYPIYHKEGPITSNFAASATATASNVLSLTVGLVQAVAAMITAQQMMISSVTAVAGPGSDVLSTFSTVGPFIP